eukprot:5757379-Pyramimonas_sp.AAC.1
MDDWCKTYYDSGSLKYFAALSKIAQVWRDSAGAIFQEFERQCGPLAAVQHAKIMLHRCIAGRWQSSHATETRLREIGPRWLVPVLNAVLEKKVSSRPDVLPIADEIDPNNETT